MPSSECCDHPIVIMCDVNCLWALSTVYAQLLAAPQHPSLRLTAGMPRHEKAGRFRGTSPLAELVDFVFFHLFWAFESGRCLPLRALEAVAFSGGCWSWRHHTRAELRAIAAVGRRRFVRAVLAVVRVSISAQGDDDWVEAERVTIDRLATGRVVSSNAQENLMRERLRAIRSVQRVVAGVY